MRSPTAVSCNSARIQTSVPSMTFDPFNLRANYGNSDSWEKYVDAEVHRPVAFSGIILFFYGEGFGEFEAEHGLGRQDNLLLPGVGCSRGSCAATQ